VDYSTNFWSPSPTHPALSTKKRQHDAHVCVHHTIFSILTLIPVLALAHSPSCKCAEKTVQCAQTCILCHQSPFFSHTHTHSCSHPHPSTLLQAHTFHVQSDTQVSDSTTHVLSCHSFHPCPCSELAMNDNMAHAMSSFVSFLFLPHLPYSESATNNECDCACCVIVCVIALACLPTHSAPS
jgi:hypothetical protein